MSASPKDWLKIPLKFRGRCSACGREIPSGEVALWSKASKTVRHVSCEPPQSANETPIPEVPSPVMELNCFICGKPSGCGQCSMALDCDRTMVSQGCICEECFAGGGDPYIAYQREFLKKARKIPKVKI